jgi:hypothetical protein
MDLPHLLATVLVDLGQVFEDGLSGMQDTFTTFSYGGKLVRFVALGHIWATCVSRPGLSGNNWRGCKCLNIVSLKLIRILQGG